MIKVEILVEERVFTATLLDSAATRALLPKLPITLEMLELNGNEKYVDLAHRLPTELQRAGRIEAGDLMLYGSNCLVLFYKGLQSSHSYTRLGRIDNPAGLADALGKGNVWVTWRGGG